MRVQTIKLPVFVYSLTTSIVDAVSITPSRSIQTAEITDMAQASGSCPCCGCSGGICCAGGEENPFLGVADRGILGSLGCGLEGLRLRGELAGRRVVGCWVAESHCFFVLFCYTQKNVFVLLDEANY